MEFGQCSWFSGKIRLVNRLWTGLTTVWGYLIIEATSFLPGLGHFEMEMWQMLVPFPPRSRWRNAVCNLDSQAPLVTFSSCSLCPAVAGHQQAFTPHICLHLLTLARRSMVRILTIIVRGQGNGLEFFSLLFIFTYYLFTFKM